MGDSSVWPLLPVLGGPERRFLYHPLPSLTTLNVAGKIAPTGKVVRSHAHVGAQIRRRNLGLY